MGAKVFLELNWAFVTQRGVFSESVVEDFDVFEGIAASMDFAGEDDVPGVSGFLCKLFSDVNHCLGILSANSMVNRFSACAQF